jgi:hypothetical protein
MSNLENISLEEKAWEDFLDTFKMDRIFAYGVVSGTMGIWDLYDFVNGYKISEAKVAAAFESLSSMDYEGMMLDPIETTNSILDISYDR